MKLSFDFRKIDCLEMLREMPDGCVDLLLQDIPYGVTQNTWDAMPNLQLMWEQWLRVTKLNGAMIFTAQQPFTSDLINSQRKLFRYDLIWYKQGKATGFLNANRMPLRIHEEIIVFYRELPTYNPQKLKGRPNNSKGSNSRGKKQTNNNYGSFDQTFQSPPTDDKFPLSIIEIASVHPPIHPTQKPVDLMRWLIKTYTNEGEVVFDGYAGSGTTAVACEIENRVFCGAEVSPEYFDIANKRIAKEKSQLKICL